MYFGDCLREQNLYIEDYFDIEESDIVTEAIDMDEGYGGQLRPIYIVLLYADSTFDKIADKFLKGQQYWHAAISFGPSLKTCYSFNMGKDNANKFKGGLTFESIEGYRKQCPNGTCQVSCVLVPKDKYDKARGTVQYYLMNKEKTSYNIKGLFDSLHGRAKEDSLTTSQVCSTFVATVLKNADIKLNDDKAANLVKPDDLRVGTTGKKKQFKVFEGDLRLYDPNKVAIRTEKLSNNLKNNYFGK